MIAFAKYKI